MKPSPFNAPQRRSKKEYLLYALGEIFLIVVGILLAMYINKLNQDYQYRNKIDNNLIRVYTELEKNITKTGGVIEVFQKKDSLIERFMSDSLKKEDYRNNVFLASLIINSQTLELQDEAYQNLIQLNTSDKKYKDALINDLKELYALNKKIKVLNEKMSDFVYNLLLTQKADIYGDFAYNGTISDELIDYFLTSKEYRLDVTRYSTLAIRNQLRRYQRFYTDAMAAYTEISKQYDLPNPFAQYSDQEMIDTFIGGYGLDSVIMSLAYKNDSILLTTSNQNNLHLIPYAKNRLFLNTNGVGYFVSFFPNDTSAMEMRIQIMSFGQVYQKVE